jgi:hypothetical protein
MNHPNFFRTNLLWCGGSLVLAVIFMFFTYGGVLAMFPSLVALLFSLITFVLLMTYGALGIILLGFQVPPRLWRSPLPSTELSYLPDGVETAANG